ncbi:TolC family outer membrane protein [Venatoribacter cucullus]|uniref:TolC family outer membrane protein n=1 Tax=Venatoribacter cucullus TaxID=2661630 RepID=UPI00223F6D4F|nr:TolC family outer membrane protein [Venatoribacter cucullus]UZK04619.1 TolC family outer membrane protein [Venatoribacter cucullus]
MNKLLSLTTALLASASLQAADLSTIYQQAASNDAEIAAARATREANGYNVTIARGALLPQASLNYSINQYDSELEAPAPTGTLKADYDTNTLQLQASMTLFNLNSWYNYQAAVTGDNAAGLELQLAEQQLLLRTAQAYFNVLRAQDNLSTAQAEEKAVKRSLEQTKQRFDVGLIAITDVHEAQAAYDLSYVNLLGQEAALDISYEALEQLTGQRFDRVVPLKAEVPMEIPEPANADDWVQSGLSKYAGVLLAEAGKDSVRLQRNAARSNHLPSVRLVGSYTDTEQYQPALGSSDPLPATSTVVGLELSVPLLAGGSLYGQSKQAALNFAAADYQLEKQRRDVRQNIRSLFRQVQTDTLNIKARKQAITSAQSAVEATETGYRVGTRNIVEVLDAQKNLYRAQRDYANARYDYILNLLNLKFFAGTLNEADLQALNGWLANGA